MNTQNKPSSTSNNKMVFACSGAADVGAITDQVARRLNNTKTASMCCTAAVAARIPEIMDKVKNATVLLALDGCPKNCVKTILNQAGFSSIKHLQLDDLGMKKGESPVTVERIEKVFNQAKLLLT